MTISFKASGITLTEAIKAYGQDKIGSVASLLADQESANLDLELEKTTAHHQKGEVFRAEVNLRSMGELFRVEKTAEDLYVAIDLVRDDLIREVKNYKSRTESIFKKGGRLAKRLLRMQ
ncbi:MAG: ribosome-associated translation inhibitor RaiA [Patescibacteria group bacterium]